MKLLQLNFIKNNFKYTAKNPPKYNPLAPLKQDTITFSATLKTKQDFKYSLAQKEREVTILKNVLNKAIANIEFIDAESLSKATGLDIYVIKLRICTNKEIRELYNIMQEAYYTKIEQIQEQQIQNAKKLFEKLKASKQKLTNNEMAFYLGMSKEEFIDLLETLPELHSLYKNTLFIPAPLPLSETKKQITAIRNALKIASNDEREAIIQKAGLTKDSIRAIFDENDKLFIQAMNKKFYPPEIYSDNEIEKQNNIIMHAMTVMIKKGKNIDNKYLFFDLAQTTELFPGVIQVRFQNDLALREIYKRFKKN